MPSPQELTQRELARLPLSIGPTFSWWIAACFGAWIAPLPFTPLLLVAWLAGDSPSPVRVLEWYYSYPVWLVCLLAVLVLLVTVLPNIGPEQAAALYARRASGKFNGWLSRYVYWYNQGLLDEYERFAAQAGEGETFEEHHQRSLYGVYGPFEQTVGPYYRTGHFRQTARGMRYVQSHSVRGHTRNR